MDTVLRQELESVTVMPSGEIRARWALIIDEDGVQKPTWHRSSYASASECPDDVKAEIENGRAEHAKLNNPAAEFFAKKDLARIVKVAQKQPN